MKLSSWKKWSLCLRLIGEWERVSESPAESCRLGRPFCSTGPASRRLSASIPVNSPVWVFSAVSAFGNWGYHHGWLVVPWGVVPEGCVERWWVCVGGVGRQLCRCVTGHCAAPRHPCCFSDKWHICSIAAENEKLICTRSQMQDKQSRTLTLFDDWLHGRVNVLKLSIQQKDPSNPYWCST